MEKIIITREDFRKAVIDANEEALKILSEKDDSEKAKTVNFLMGLQNVTFGSMIEHLLFKSDAVETEKGDK